jgi:hypothetical protein
MHVDRSVGSFMYSCNELFWSWQGKKHQIFMTCFCALLSSECLSGDAVNLLKMGDKGIEGVCQHKNGVTQAHGNFLLAICMKEVLESKSAHAVVEDWCDVSLCSLPCIRVLTRPIQ